MHEIVRGRGRPRPAETLVRDANIERMLYISRSLREIAYMEKLSHGQTYHALRRLQRAGRVQTIRDGKRHLWALITTTHA